MSSPTDTSEWQPVRFNPRGRETRHGVKAREAAIAFDGEILHVRPIRPTRPMRANQQRDKCDCERVFQVHVDDVRKHTPEIEDLICWIAECEIQAD